VRYYDWQDSEHDRSRFVRNLDWNLLKVFSEIVRASGVSRAAQAMARQQPSVSSALKRLEDHLGVVLCRRGPGGFELTEHGKTIFDLCRRFEIELETLPERFMDIARLLHVQIRLVTVGNVVSKTLDAALAEFCRAFPRAEIMISVAPWLDIEKQLVNNEVDIGVAPSPRENERLNRKFLYRERNVPLCGPLHPLFGRKVANPAELARETFVLLGATEAEPVRKYREAHGWGAVRSGQSLDPNEVKRMLMVSQAVALLPREFLEPDIVAGRLWELMDPPIDAQVDMYVLTSPANPRHEALCLFLDMLGRLQGDGEAPEAAPTVVDLQFPAA